MGSRSRLVSRAANLVDVELGHDSGALGADDDAAWFDALLVVVLHDQPAALGG
jgi:hypothetical protein